MEAWFQGLEVLARVLFALVIIGLFVALGLGVAIGHFFM